MQDPRPDDIHYSYIQSIISLDQDFPISICAHNTKSDPLDILHSHDVLEMGLCLKGSGIFIINNRVINYQKVDIVLIISSEAEQLSIVELVE